MHCDHMQDPEIIITEIDEQLSLLCTYGKVVRSRPVFIQCWTILSKGHTTYISIKITLHKQSKNPWVWQTKTVNCLQLYGMHPV